MMTMVYNAEYTESIFELVILIKWMLWYIDYISVNLSDIYIEPDIDIQQWYDQK